MLAHSRLPGGCFTVAIEHVIGLETRIADLKRKLAARSGRAEYVENCEALKVEITRLEALQFNAALASENPEG